jgi:hypothetical protein
MKNASEITPRKIKLTISSPEKDGSLMLSFPKIKTESAEIKLFKKWHIIEVKMLPL